MHPYTQCKQALLKLAAPEEKKRLVQLVRKLREELPEELTVRIEPRNKKLMQLWGGGVYGDAKEIAQALKRKDLGGGKMVMLMRADDPSTLAHELGHAQFDKGLVGRVLQNPHVRGIGSALGASMGPLAGLVVGSATGSRLAGAAAGAITPFIGRAPVLIGEAVASKKAIDSLRRAGMNEKEIDAAKRDLGKALLTYMRSPVKAAVLGAMVGGVSGHLAGG